MVAGRRTSAARRAHRVARGTEAARRAPARPGVTVLSVMASASRGPGMGVPAAGVPHGMVSGSRGRRTVAVLRAPHVMASGSRGPRTVAARLDPRGTGNGSRGRGTVGVLRVPRVMVIGSRGRRMVGVLRVPRVMVIGSRGRRMVAVLRALHGMASGSRGRRTVAVLRDLHGMASGSRGRRTVPETPAAVGRVRPATATSCGPGTGVRRATIAMPRGTRRLSRRSSSGHASCGPCGRATMIPRSRRM